VIQTDYTPEHYTGTGALTNYAFTWRILRKQDLIAITRDTSDVVVTLTLDTDYTIADSSVNNGAGGEIVLTSPLALNTELFLNRETDLTQKVHIEEGSPFPSSVVEEVFDRLTMMLQEARYLYRQSLHFPTSSTVADVTVPEPDTKLLLQWLSSALVNSDGANLLLTALPTSDPGVAGQLWNSLGTVKVSL